MNKSNKVDYIIVGQGIAGTCVAYQLIKNGFSVLVVDEGHTKSASAVAAGLYNPIVFKRFTHSWMATELINYLDVFYRELEALLKINVHRKLEILKILSNDNEAALWAKKASQSVFMSNNICTNYYTDAVKPNSGIGAVSSSGAIDVYALITSFRNFLLSKDSLLEEKFDYDAIINQKLSVLYKTINAKAIVFCEGANALQNPYFPANAFKLTHGELLEIETQKLPTNTVLNKGVFVLPFGEENYRVGSTYEWNDVHGNATDKGLQELTTKLESIVSANYKVVKHKAGIRPTVADRRPLIGKSKKHNNLFFFNGMGTKGVMLAPYFSNVFVSYLINQTSLHNEIDIARYF